MKCKECGADVSDKAAVCQHCGAPVAKPKPSTSNAALIVVPVGAVVLFAVLGTLLPPKPPDPEAEAKAVARKTIELCWQEQQRKSLSPDTQRFIAGACEQAEADFIRRYGHKP